MASGGSHRSDALDLQKKNKNDCASRRRKRSTDLEWGGKRGPAGWRGPEPEPDLRPGEILRARDSVLEILVVRDPLE